MSLTYWRNALPPYDPHRPDVIQHAMPMVIRVEKNAPPTQEDALEAAITAFATLMDADDDAALAHRPVMEAWMTGAIRKVVRRARGARWADAESMPGYTITRGTAAVRALFPHPLDEVPPLLKRMQVSGLELVSGSVSPLARMTPPYLSVMLNDRVEMTSGKKMAQACHAVHLFVLNGGEDKVNAWTAAGYPVRMVAWQPGRTDAHFITDAGFTEVEPGTVTAGAYYV